MLAEARLCTGLAAIVPSPSSLTGRIRSLAMLSPRVMRVIFEVEGPFRFQAGQHIQVIVPGAGIEGRDLKTYYSIASAPESRAIELCIKVSEDAGSRYLRRLSPGDRFQAIGPFGSFRFHREPNRNSCFVAMGTGIAPLKAMMLSEGFQRGPRKTAFCVFGGRDESSILYRDLATLDNLQWCAALSQPGSGWKGFKGRVTDYLQTLNSEFPWRECDFYLCGKPAMVKEVKQICLERGVDPGRIFHEVYGSY